MKYEQQKVEAYFKSMGLTAPVFEHKFHHVRRWRFDLAWPDEKVALEVQGGIWTNGRHSRGAALLNEWEKLNTAAGLGWRMLYCQPKDLCKKETVEYIRAALEYNKG